MSYKSVLEALKLGDLRDLFDLLAEDVAVDPNAEYDEENFITLLNTALEIGNTKAMKLPLAGGAKPDLFNSVIKLTPIHLAASKGAHIALIFCTGNF